jgi:hypothetical protein
MRRAGEICWFDFPMAVHSLADTTDRINAALVAGSDASQSEVMRKASLRVWSENVDRLPNFDDRIMFAEAAMTYAARLPAGACEVVRAEAREKLSELKGSGFAEHEKEGT